ncbi:methyltransferase domain-containing protein [Burkholderiales bacterium]|nr:methyltransferase domain-containing protein [Burkholderiales bacterium]
MPKNTSSDANSYQQESLLPENVYGHTKKIRLIRDAIERHRRVVKKDSLRVLDIGCGNGFAVTRFLAKNCDYVEGIDLHPTSIAYADKHFGGANLKFFCVDAQDHLAADKVFDVVVMADVLEHVDNPDVFLEAGLKLLAPGGLLCLTVPNGTGPFEIEKSISNTPYIGYWLLKMTDLIVAALNKWVLKGVWSSSPAIPEPKELPYNAECGHVQFFSEGDILNLLQISGLEFCQVSQSLFPGWSIHQLLLCALEKILPLECSRCGSLAA